MPKANAAPANPPEEKHPAVAYLKRLGGGFSIAGAVALIPLHYYWCGVVGIYLGLLIFVIDVLFENWKPRYRLLVCAFWVTVAAVFSHYVVFVSAPLDVLTNSTWGNYDVGTNVHGVVWEPGMTELRFAISNPTQFSYDGIDLIVKPSVPTRKVSQVTSVPDVSLDVLEKAGGLETANFTMRALGPDGQPGQDIPTEVFASAEGFRLRCPCLPPNTTLQIEAALVTFTVHSDNPATIIMGGGAGPKALAKSAFVKGDFNVLNRPHHIEYTYAVRQQ